MNRLVLTSIAIVIALVCDPALATTYYVRISGNDANTGLSPTTSLRTLTRAFNLAQGGDTIYIGAGTYTDTPQTVRSGGTSSPIRVVGDSAGVFSGDAGTIRLSPGIAATALTIAHNNMFIEQISITNANIAFLVSGSTVSLRSCTASDSNTLVRVTAGSTTATSCTFNAASVAAFDIRGGSFTALSSSIDSITGPVIVTSGTGSARVNRATLKDNEGRLVQSTQGSAAVLNCLIRNSRGVDVSGTADVDILNCTFDGITSDGLAVQSGALDVRNCIVVNSTLGVVRNGGTLVHTHNLYHNVSIPCTGTTVDSTSIQANPQFVSSTDWRLQSTSPAINRGTTLSTWTTVDRNGGTRPQGGSFDIGAYEVSGSIASTPYFANFDSSAGPEWTPARLHSRQNHGQMLGYFVNESAQLRVATTVNTTYTLIFDAVALNTWDGNNRDWGFDVFGVTVDDSEVFRETFGFIEWGSTLDHFSWPDYPENWSDKTGIIRRVAIPFTARSSITHIGFYGQGLQGWSDEGWALDNVRVLTSSAAAEYIPTFVETARVRRSAVDLTAGGVPSSVWGDLNADGLLDNLIIGAQSNASIVQYGQANSVSQQTLSNPMKNHVALADLDNDGKLDGIGIANNAPGLAAYLTNSSDVLINSTISGLSAPGDDGLAILDVNSDGICDVLNFGTTSTWVGLGQLSSGSLSYTATSDIVPSNTVGDGHFVSTADANNDGVPDILLHTSTGLLLLSQPEGSYSLHTMGIATFSDINRVGSAWGDYNNDGHMDVAIGNIGGTLQFLKNNGNAASFSSLANTIGLSLATGVCTPSFGDYDNDGDLDLLVNTATGSSTLYQNSGSPQYTFSLVSFPGCTTESRSGDCLFVDYDNDGQLDVNYTNIQSRFTTRLYRNLATSSRFLKVRIQGYGEGGINAAGLGARVELWNADGTQFLQRREVGTMRGYGGQDPLWVHFGGVTPSTTYTLKFVSGSKTHSTQIIPSTCQTSIGGTSIAQMYTFIEPTPGARVVRWREVSSVDHE